MFDYKEYKYNLPTVGFLITRSREINDSVIAMRNEVTHYGPIEFMLIYYAWWKLRVAIWSVETGCT